MYISNTHSKLKVGKVHCGVLITETGLVCKLFLF